MSFKCFFGFHKWEYSSYEHVINFSDLNRTNGVLIGSFLIGKKYHLDCRTCHKCFKKQKQRIDGSWFASELNIVEKREKKLKDLFDI